jgi:16S rRNA (cytosine967-C5)-methyltransferase
MKNQGRIVAVDISEKRMKLLRENSQRLGTTIIEESDLSLQFDRVLVDAPCSGTGTIGKHPEILQSLAEKDFKTHAQTQLKLLQQGFSLLKPGGVLVYSTCSIDAEENKNVVELFLNRQEISVILPTENRDGFFIFKAVKA